jgi:tetratricopeptide (TPR) repeat protein
MAQNFARKALKKTSPLHAVSIKFYCILMQAFYMEEKISEADVCFTKALEILDHHWGPFHPLHINIYSIMAQLLIHKGKHDDAIYLYKASLLCCLRILGPNHIQTGDVHMDFGKLYLLKSKKESLVHFIEAYLIFESYFGQYALQTAEAAINVAEVLEEEGKLREAYAYAKVAASTFSNVYSVENPTTIKALWQQLSISYALEEPDTVKQCAHLLNALTKRDLSKHDDDSVNKKGIRNTKSQPKTHESKANREVLP